MLFQDAAQSTRAPFVEVFDTQHEPPARRFAFWGDLVHLICGPLRVARGGGENFNGVIVKGAFGSVQVAVIEAAPHTVELTPHLIKNADYTPLYVCCVRKGEARVTQDGLTAQARAGSLITFDGSRPFTLTVREQVSMVTVKFEHRLLGLTPGEEHPLKAVEWSGGRGVGKLVWHLLDNLASHITELTPAHAEPLGDSLAGLISAMCADSLRRAAEVDSAAARRALLQRIQVYARENLGDPALCPIQLARRHNVSLRYLQLLFQEESTSPARWIRGVRLERCRRDLSNPRFSHLTVANIAERWGLGASHFSRLFRERYHLTPREWRRRSTLRIP